MKKLKSTFLNLLYLVKLSKRECPSTLAVSAALGLDVALVSIFAMVMPKIILDALIFDKSFTKALAFILLLALGEGLGRGLMGVIGQYFQISVDKFVHVLTLKLGQKAMKLDYSDIKSNDIAQNYQSAQNVTYQLQYNVSLLLSDFLSNVISLIMISTIISVLSGWMVLIIFAFVIIRLILMDMFNKREYKYRLQEDKINLHLVYAQGIFSGQNYAKEIRTYEAKRFLKKKYNEARDEKFRIIREKNIFSRKIQALNCLLEVMILGLAYAIIIYKYLDGNISITSVTMYISAVIMIYSTLSEILKVIVHLKDTNRLMDIYYSFMNYPENISKSKKNSKDARLELPIKTIEFKNVYFKYPYTQKYIFEDFSATFYQNEKIGIIGENGAGKSTFANLLLRLYDVESGDILINGTSVKNFDYESYCDIIGAIPQDYSLFCFSIKENIAFDKYDSKRDLYDDSLRIVDMADLVSALPSKDDTYMSRWFTNGTDFSGGERQRFAIARGLFKNAPVLIMDEPNAAIDPFKEKTINNEIFRSSEDKIIFNISHRLSVTKDCDRIMVLDNGKIIEFGSHDELMKAKGMYYNMFSTQSKYYLN